MNGTEALLFLLAHFIGDYVIQTDHMAQEKTKRWWPAILHGVTYTIPFLIVTQSPWALLVIGGTHIVIDRFRLARYLCWAKNLFGPKEYRKPWSECTKTGYPDDRPVWLTTWLMIVADNTIHICINLAAVLYL